MQYGIKSRPRIFIILFSYTLELKRGKSALIYFVRCVWTAADSPPPSFSSQNRSNGASHMGPRGPPAPPGTGNTGTGGVPSRLGPTAGGGGGGSAGGGTGTGQEPSPMDMSIGPQPSQPMTASHGM